MAAWFGHIGQVDKGQILRIAAKKARCMMRMLAKKRNFATVNGAWWPCRRVL